MGLITTLFLLGIGIGGAAQAQETLVEKGMVKKRRRRHASGPRTTNMRTTRASAPKPTRTYPLTKAMKRFFDYLDDRFENMN